MLNIFYYTAFKKVLMAYSDSYTKSFNASQMKYPIFRQYQNMNTIPTYMQRDFAVYS